MKGKIILFISVILVSLGAFVGVLVFNRSYKPVKARNATCTEDGTIAYYENTITHRCYSVANGSWLGKSTDEDFKEAIKDSEKPALGHNTTYTERKEATCTEVGNIEYWYCSDCKKYYSDEGCTKEIFDIVISAGHTAKVNARKEATCTAEGNIAYWYCSVCGKYFNDENCLNEITQAGTIIAAINHKNKEHVPYEAATCTEDGNIEYWYCPDCDGYFSDKNCTNEITQSETVVKALGHSTTVTEAKEATCTTNGNIKYWHCSTCNKYFGDKHCTVEISYTDTVIAASHTTKATTRKEATCTENGNIAYWYCTVCEKYFSDEACQNEITKEETIIEGAAGHTPIFANNAVAATCTTEGKESDTICSVCHEMLTTGAAIPATGHNWEFTTVVIASGATTGAVTYSCQNNKETASWKIAFSKIDEATLVSVNEGTPGTIFNSVPKAKYNYYPDYNEFCGWYLDEEYTEAFNEEEIKNTPRDLTLYAKWQYIYRNDTYDGDDAIAFDSPITMVATDYNFDLNSGKGNVIVDWSKKRESDIGTNIGAIALASDLDSDLSDLPIHATSQDINVVEGGLEEGILEINNKISELTLIGISTQKFYGLYIQICGFVSEQKLTIRLVNFMYVSNEETAIELWEDKGVELTIETIGICAISSTYTSGSIIGTVDAKPKIINFIGSGELTLTAGNGTDGADGTDVNVYAKVDTAYSGESGDDGGCAVFCDVAIINMDGTLVLIGGDGGDGGNGGDVTGESDQSGQPKLHGGGDGGDGGDGGASICSSQLSIVKCATLVLQCGNGGDGGDGGKGGSAKEEDAGKPDNGGDGGNGGKGGNGYIGGDGGNGGKGGGSFGRKGGFLNLTSYKGTSGDGGDGGDSGNSVCIIAYEDGIWYYDLGTVGNAGTAGERGSIDVDPNDACQGNYGNNGNDGNAGVAVYCAVNTTYNGHKYFLMTGTLSWIEAKSIAEEMGGHLATITSSEENAALKTMFIATNLTGAWLGAAKTTDGTWKWVTGETWDYIDWGEGEPSDDGGEEDYVGYYKAGSNQWNDYRVGSTTVQGFIVEFD